MNPQDIGSPPPILLELLERLHTAWPARRFADVTSLIAISGGADSVALLRLLHASFQLANRQRGSDDTQRLTPGRLLVAHFNHGLRGADSDADEAFVRDLCQRLNVDCIVGRAATSRASMDVCQPPLEGPVEQGGTVAAGVPKPPGEASLRAERYAFLDRTAHQCGARYVVTAHTSDDQVETVLHQMFRGSGPLGLAGMPRFRDLGEDAVLVRPLLDIAKAELRNLLQTLEQPWREDSSNAATHWQRNWLRSCLLPEIRTRYGDADQAIARAARTQQTWVDDLRGLARDWAAHALIFKDQKLSGQYEFPADLPPPAHDNWLLINHRAAPATLQRRSILVVGLMQAWDHLDWPRGQMTQAHWDALAELIESTEPVTQVKNRAAENTAAPGQQPPDFLNLPGNLRARLVDSRNRASVQGAPSPRLRFVVVERLAGD